VQTVVVEHVEKSFARTQAVRDVSFSVEAGEIFALLGPNGAGKTTTIRMLLGILQPDAGRIAVLGGPMTERTRDRVGYLPEDRGLYRNLRLHECLMFLAGLKGLTGAEARRRVDSYLERFDLAAHRKKKISELSRGMQQKTQVIAALLHDPALLVVDEPFAGLDPVNVHLIKDVLRERAAAGTTVLLSAHEMHLVQELAGRMAMIHQGRVVLYGRIQEVRRSFVTNDVIVQGYGSLDLAGLPGVCAAAAQNDGTRLALAEGVAPRDVLRALNDHDDFVLERFELAMPNLDDIFVRVARNQL
jgi:ABC-2 type transport system ATP-binding protein